VAAVGALLVGLAANEPATAQKQSGVLRIAHRDSPASMSTLEEATISTIAPMMAVFNNLAVFDQHTPQNTIRRAPVRSNSSRTNRTRRSR